MAAKRKTVRRKTSPKKAVRKVSSSYSDRTASSDKTIFILALALVIAIGGYLFLSSKSKTMESTSLVNQKMATVALDPQNKSGEAGTATVKEVDGKVQVMVEVTGAPQGVSQPAHIHVGACPAPGDIKYPLTSLVDGKSETILDVTFDDLMKQLPLAVNVHKSVSQVKTYVACGDVTTPSY